jgi:hypothetical protein
MNERDVMKVINVDGIERCVRRLGFSGQTQISDIRLGKFVPDAFYDRAKRVLSKPNEQRNLWDKIYLRVKRGDLPRKEDAEGIVKGSYDIVRMIPLNSIFVRGMGPHQIGTVEVERMPFDGRERRWVEEARIELHEELNAGIPSRVPPLVIRLTHNEYGKGELARADYVVFSRRFEKAGWERYFPTAEITKSGAIGGH